MVIDLVITSEKEWCCESVWMLLCINVFAGPPYKLLENVCILII